MLVVSILSVLIILILILLIVGGSAGRKETRRLEKKNREALKNAKREAKNKNRYEDILKQEEIKEQEIPETPKKEAKHFEPDPEPEVPKLEPEPEVSTDLDADIQFLFDEDLGSEEIQEEKQEDKIEEIEDKEEKTQDQELDKDPIEQLKEQIDTVIVPEEPEIDRKALDELIDKYIREAKEKANDIGYLNGDGPEEPKEEKDPLAILKEQEKEEITLELDEAEEMESEEDKVEEIGLDQKELEKEEIDLEQDEIVENEIQKDEEKKEEQ